MDGQTGRGADGQKSPGPSYRAQLVWRKSQDFAEAVVALAADLPQDRAVDVICRQLLRSATSIAANFAEGYGRFSQAAYRNHLSIARGSAFESESWIDLLSRRGYISPGVAASLLKQCDEIERLLTVRMKSLGGGKTYASKDEPDD